MTIIWSITGAHHNYQVYVAIVPGSHLTLPVETTSAPDRRHRQEQTVGQLQLRDTI